MADRTSEELVLQVSATEELLNRQLREMGQNVDTFEQAAEKRLNQLEQRFTGLNLTGAIDAVKDADRAFKASLDNMRNNASSLAEAFSQSGTVDLSPILSQARSRLSLLEAEAAVTRTLQGAEEARLGTVERLTVEEQASLAAGRALVNASREKAAAAAQEVARLEQLQSELGIVAVAQGRVVQTSGSMRFAMQNAGFQVQDFFVQVSGGTSALRAFSQQAPQLIGALQMMANGAEQGAGKFAAFANFMAGGWGIAVGIAIPLIVTLAQQLLDVGDSAEKSKTKVDALTQSIANMLGQKGRFDLAKFSDDVTRPLIQKQADLKNLNNQINAQQKLLSQAGAAVLAGNPGADVYAASIERKIAALTATKKQLEGEIAQLNRANEVLPLQRAAALRGDQDAADAKDEKNAARLDAAAQHKADAAAKRQQKAEESAAKKAAAAQAKFEKDLHDNNISALEKFTGAKDIAIGGKDDLLGKAIASDDYWRELRETSQGIQNFEKTNAEAAKKIKADWVEASQGIISSLQSVKSSIQSGDFLDILSAALGLFTQLGGLGVFGKSIQTNLRNSIPARAGGGPVNAGMPYIVGERGQELFVPNTSGRIISNSDLRSPRVGSAVLSSIASSRNQPVHIVVAANDYFDARVDQRATGVAAPLAMRAADAGSSTAVTTINRSRRNRIPSRF